MSRISRTILAGVLTFATSAFSQTFIVPSQDCGEVTFQLMQGGAFPSPGEPIDVDRVSKAQVDLQRRRVPMKPSAGPRSVQFIAGIPQGELVMAVAELRPTVTANETLTEQAKALVRCGTSIGDGNWRRSAGLRLEIFPQWNEGIPLERGHEMRFIVVDNSENKLVRDVRMELYRADDGNLGAAVSDRSGIVTFPQTGRGRYLVTATLRRPDPNGQSRWLVDTTSLMFDVK